MSTDLAIPDGDVVPGLEDYDPSTDAGTPRLTIVQDQAVFEDSATGEQFAKITAILLGQVKQRTLWPASMGDDKKPPLCRSYDHKVGHPGEEFPWKESGFDLAAAGEPPVVGCEACPLKEWESHPDPAKSIPWCSEQIVFPLLMQLPNGVWAPAILTLQRSNIKPSNQYVTGFARARLPLFTAITELTLDPRKKGSNKYAVIELKKGIETDKAMWPEYADQLRNFRTFLQTPRAADQDAADEGSAPVPSAGTGAVPADDDELPF